MSRKYQLAAALAAASLIAAPAGAQSFIINDVIASTVANMVANRLNQGPTEECLAGHSLPASELKPANG